MREYDEQQLGKESGFPRIVLILAQALRFARPIRPLLNFCAARPVVCGVTREGVIPADPGIVSTMQVSLPSALFAELGRGRSINCPHMPYIGKRLPKDCVEKEFPLSRQSDFNGLRSGVVCGLCQKPRNIRRVSSIIDSSGKIPLVADTGRHWFTYLEKIHPGTRVIDRCPWSQKKCRRDAALGREQDEL